MPRRVWLPTLLAYLAAVAAALVLVLRPAGPSIAVLAPVGGAGPNPAPAPARPAPWAYLRIRPVPALDALGEAAGAAATVLTGFPPSASGFMEAVFPGWAGLTGPLPAARGG